MDDVTGEVTELLQQLIRNACVNDGAPDSGEESRNADLLGSYLDGSGIDIERYEPVPGRASVVGRIEGRDPAAPSLLLMGHTDVVPANADGWQRDPFGGELVDGEVWGRGAIDMLNLTASMAVATRHLADEGFRPAGDLIYLGVADEENLGDVGAGWLVEHESDAVHADYLITESGGIPIPTPTGVKLPVIVGEKGTHWTTLRVRGTPGHGSSPLLTDNALVKAAEVVRRIDAYRPEAQIHATWRRLVESMGFPPELSEPMLTADGFREMAEALPMVGLARLAHACTHTTFAPTVIRGGAKVNVIPDLVDIDVDIRTLPGQTGEEIDAMVRDALGDLADQVEIIVRNDDPATESPADTPLWDCLQRVTSKLAPDSKTVPLVM
ncbi:MAG: acetylornithine deacetylase/succinyldiaminopimelate desuccinylase-like deacylase, partial [Acidimicrobiales bacterium]|nr:acetylornithine deacetylase/succinyldiaminopimelate desuccinylase-like deacylase [Acidimicrobiales bacterium]